MNNFKRVFQFGNSTSDNRVERGSFTKFYISLNNYKLKMKVFDGHNPTKSNFTASFLYFIKMYQTTEGPIGEDYKRVTPFRFIESFNKSTKEKEVILEYVEKDDLSRLEKCYPIKKKIFSTEIDSTFVKEFDDVFIYDLLDFYMHKHGYFQVINGKYELIDYEVNNTLLPVVLSDRNIFSEKDWIYPKDSPIHKISG